MLTKLVQDPNLKIPKNHSFTTLQEHIKDPLTEAKLQFFITVAKVLLPFLEAFQTKRPMLPFMAEYLQNTLHTILQKFIQKGVMDKATSVAKPAKIEVSEKENLLPTKNVDICFATRKVVNNLQAKKTVRDKFWSFRVNVLHFCRH